MMKIFIFMLLTAVSLATFSPVFAGPLSITGNTTYEYTKQAGQSPDSTPNITLNLDYSMNNNFSFHSSFETSRMNTQPISNTINYAYLELNRGKTTYAVGRPSYTLSNGLIASVSGVNSILATHKNAQTATSVFYSKEGQDILAADWAANTVKGSKNLTLETVYFKMNDSYAGITVSDQLSKNMLLSVETAKNMTTRATGYLITNKFGNAQQQGQMDLSISYRNIQPGAVSAYSINSNYDNSRGFSLGTDYRISTDLTLTAFRDFVTARDHSNKDETDISLSRDF